MIKPTLGYQGFLMTLSKSRKTRNLFSSSSHQLNILDSSYLMKLVLIKIKNNKKSLSSNDDDDDGENSGRERPAAHKIKRSRKWWW